MGIDVIWNVLLHFACRHLLLQFCEFYQTCNWRIPLILQHPWARSFLLIVSNRHLILLVLSECLKQWGNYVGNTDASCLTLLIACRLSLISSVDSRTSTLFSRVTTLFSSEEDILPWSTSTNLFNSEISLLDFVLISFFGDSGCLAADFHFFFAHIALYLVN